MMMHCLGEPPPLGILKHLNFSAVQLGPNTTSAPLTATAWLMWSCTEPFECYFWATAAARLSYCSMEVPHHIHLQVVSAAVRILLMISSATLVWVLWLDLGFLSVCFGALFGFFGWV